MANSPGPVLTLLAGLCCAAAATADRLTWGNDLAAAYRQAEETGRPLIVHVTSNACGYKAPIGNPGDAHETDCELLQMQTLETAGFTEAASRFVLAVVFHTSAGGTPSEAELVRRHRIGTIPTLLVTDPWGNEIIRMIGPTPVAKAVRVLHAVPEDFRPLRAAGEALRRDPERLEALLAAAAFYEAAGVRPFAERYYERAALTPAAKADPKARRELVIARGLNLLQMNQPKDAARLFADEAGTGLSLPQSDVILFGWAMADLAAGDKPKAQKLSDDLRRLFPDSAYTKRLQQNLK